MPHCSARFFSSEEQHSEGRTALPVQSRTPLPHTARVCAYYHRRLEESIWAQTFTSRPHASSNSWGTYLLSLFCCAHFFNGIELRYSCSDSFNRRTISSNEVGVLGMFAPALPQFGFPLDRNLCTSESF